MTKLIELTSATFFNCVLLLMNRLKQQLSDPCLSTDDLSEGLENLNYQYPAYKRTSGFKQCDAEEKWIIFFNFISGYLTTMDVILHL